MLRLAPRRLLILVRVPNAFPSFLRLGLLPCKALVLMDTQFHPVPASVSGRRQHCCFGSSMRADAAAPASLLEFRTPFHQLECCVGTHVCVTRPCPYGSMEAWMRGLPNLPVPLHSNSGRNLVEEQSMYLMHWSIAVNVRSRPPSQSHLNGKVQPNRSRVDSKLTAYGNVDCHWKGR